MEMNCGEFKKDIHRVSKFVNYLATKVFELDNYSEDLKTLMMRQKEVLQTSLREPFTTLCMKFNSLFHLPKPSFLHIPDINLCLQELRWLEDLRFEHVLGNLQESLKSFRKVRRFLEAQLPMIQQQENKELLSRIKVVKRERLLSKVYAWISGLPDQTATQQSTQFSSALILFTDGLKPVIEGIIELTLISCWEGRIESLK